MEDLFVDENERKPLETSIDATLHTKNVTFRTDYDEEEVVSDATSSRKSKSSDKRNRTIIRWLCVYIVGVALAAGGILGGLCGGLQVCSLSIGSNKADDDTPSQPQGFYDNDSNDVDLFRGPKQSFGSTFELQTAVQLYAEYDRNSVRKYGKNITEWDVSKVEDFSFLFDSRRIQNEELLSDENLQFWNMSNAKTLEGMFLGQRRFRGNGLEHWDVSKVTSLRSTFADCLRFSGDISNWNTSSVLDISFLLAGSSGYVGNLSAWNTSAVTSMEYSFYGLTYFNSDLSFWNVENVKNFSAMFSQCEAFRNDDLSRWNTSKASDMSHMFAQAKRFNGNISTWDVRNVKTLGSFLEGAEIFGGDLSTWQPESCVDLSYAFRGTRRFDSDLGDWNIQNVQTLEGTFQDARVYSGKGLERWNTSLVRTLVSTFDLSNIGEIDLSNWNVRNVNDFAFAFYGTHVSSDLSRWDTSSGITFQSMVRHAYCER